MQSSQFSLTNWEPKNPKILAILRETDKVIVGQWDARLKMLIALLSNQHLLFQSVPGLAKTLMVKCLEFVIEGLIASRIQFTPDKMPGDIAGSEIFNQAINEMVIRWGPAIMKDGRLANLILADEINRANPKTQSALLEPMAERQASIGGQTVVLPRPYTVFGTQNPIDHDGTFMLPFAQRDRFQLMVKLPYPTLAEEVEIASRVSVHLPNLRELLTPQTTVAELVAMQDEVREMVARISPAVMHYAAALTTSTQCETEDFPASPEFAQAAAIWNKAGAKEFQRVGIGQGRHKLSESFRVDLSTIVQLGAGPRATISLAYAAASLAYMDARQDVSWYDVQRIAADCLRHRIVIATPAAYQGIRPDHVVNMLLDPELGVKFHPDAG